MKKTEILYLGFLSLVVTAVLVTIWQLWQKFTVGNLIQTVGDACCQFLIKISQTGVQVVGMGTMYLLVIAAAFLSLKACLSLIKTTLMIRQVLSIKLKTKSTRLNQICLKYQIDSDYVVVIKSERLIVCTLGLWQPKIVISNSLVNLVSDEELEAVMLHEYHHWRNFHPFLFMVGEVVGLSFSFIPIIQEISTLMKLKMEQEADNWAAKIQGTTAYLNQALLKLSQVPVENQTFYPAFSALRTQERLSNLAGQPLTNVGISRSSIISFLVVVGFLIVLFKTPTTVQGGVFETQVTSSSQMCARNQASNVSCGATEPANQSSVPNLSPESQ